MILQAEISEEDKKKLTDILYKPLPEEIIQKIKDIYNYMAGTGTFKFMAMPDEEHQLIIEIKDLKDEKAKEVWYAAKWKDEVQPGRV